MLRLSRVSMFVHPTSCRKAAHFRCRTDHCIHRHSTDMQGRAGSRRCSCSWHVVLPCLFDYLFHIYSLVEIGHVGETSLQSLRNHTSNILLPSRPTYRRKNLFSYNTLYCHDRPSNAGARFWHFRFGNTTPLPTSKLPNTRTRRCGDSFFPLVTPVEICLGSPSADTIGLKLMARACFNPQASPE